jgi:8-oxo-dGTP diphosphatase
MMPVVRAAGGIVVNDRGEVLLVHRDRYDDWSFPKGKAEPGESDEDCALREVEEETGLRCALGEELASTSYMDARGRPKIVRYWLMQPVDGALEYRHEVDAARWVPIAEARDVLTYARDAALLDRIASHLT